MVTAVTLTDFAECRTIPETNELYKRLFIQMKAAHDRSVVTQLQELHRRAMERLTVEIRAVEAPVRRERETDPDAIPQKSIRNWAIRRNLVVGKGKIPMEIENQYREANHLPLIEAPPEVPSLAELGVTAKEVRRWLVSEGHDTPARGRLRPDLILTYHLAHLTPEETNDED